MPEQADRGASNAALGRSRGDQQQRRRQSAADAAIPKSQLPLWPIVLLLLLLLSSLLLELPDPLLQLPQVLL